MVVGETTILPLATAGSSGTPTDGRNMSEYYISNECGSDLV